MFETISDTFQNVFQSFRSQGKLTEENIKEGMREVRRSLLQADVNYQVAKDFISNVEEQAVGEEVIESVQPDQQIVKIVQDELEDLMGPVDHDLPSPEEGPAVYMLVGLQGSGKTTSCAKLAKYLREEDRNPLMVAADLRRPAAIDQLETLGSDLDIPVYSREESTAPELGKGAIQHARENNLDTVLIDTAGRLHIDREMMNELSRVRSATSPDHIFLVADAMTGQDAVNSASEFDEEMDYDSVILTKLDGDARGGAALSIRAVTGKPIQFVGVGEKPDNLEPFHPDRMASRILGMGDVVTLVEKAQETMDEEYAEKMQERLMSGKFNLQDMLEQFQKVKQMGPIKKLLKMFPGMGQFQDQLDQFDEGEMARVEAMIQSMTPKERKNPDILNYSRKKRVARGSGTTVKEINSLLKVFEQNKELVKKMKEGGLQGGLGGGGESNFPSLPFDSSPF